MGPESGDELRECLGFETTAGVVFSLTVVILRLASGQFSPRVLRTFVRDRLSQVVIGLLVATFVGPDPRRLVGGEVRA